MLTLLCFTGSEVSEQDICPKGQSVHILCCCGKDLPCFNQSSTAGLRLTWSLKHISQNYSPTPVLLQFISLTGGKVVVARHAVEQQTFHCAPTSNLLLNLSRCIEGDDILVQGSKQQRKHTSYAFSKLSFLNISYSQ